MKDSIKSLLQDYQVRKTVKQKEGFIHWLETHSQRHGYELKYQDYRKKGKNIYVGNPETAEVFLTAHYDTPPNFFIPIFAGLNLFSFTLSQLYLAGMLFLPVIILTALAGFAGWSYETTTFLTYTFLLLYGYQILAGLANKSNANDNTSGVAVLISLLEDLTPAQREKVCFVFFDEEEKGLVGAFAFKKEMAVNGRPLINFDCVANGRHLIFVAKKAFLESDLGRALEQAAAANPRMKIKKALTNVYASDQIIFDNSVGVAAMKKLPILGYCLVGIHSALDKKFDAANIEEISEGIQTWLGKLEQLPPQTYAQKESKLINTKTISWALIAAGALIGFFIGWGNS